MKEGLAFIVGVMIPTYEFVNFIVQTFGKRIKKALVRSSADAVAYEHYKMRRMGQGHSASSPVVCSDGDCPRLAR